MAFARGGTTMTKTDSESTTRDWLLSTARLVRLLSSSESTGEQIDRSRFREIVDDLRKQAALAGFSEAALSAMVDIDDQLAQLPNDGARRRVVEAVAILFGHKELVRP
jgi:hypothetical protein